MAVEKEQCQYKLEGALWEGAQGRRWAITIGRGWGGRKRSGMIFGRGLWCELFLSAREEQATERRKQGEKEPPSLRHGEAGGEETRSRLRGGLRATRVAA